MESGQLTEDEVKLYDRQIRLWGADAQRRMRDSKVLLIGFKGLNAEVCKNIVIAGINSVTILESGVTSLQDLGSHIFLEYSDVGHNRGTSSIRNISLLNPNAKLSSDETLIESKSEDFFKQFQVVCATNCNAQQLKFVNELCRKNGIFFFAADNFGQFGYFFSDLKSYSYVKKAEGEENADKPQEVVTTHYSSFESAFSLNDWTRMKRTPALFFGLNVLFEFQKKEGRNPKSNDESDLKKWKEISEQILKDHKVQVDFVSQEFLQSFANNVSAEISPVCAVIGGILGQEIIKVISGKDEALNNFFFYNPIFSRNSGETAKIPS
eukprot:TRINITY_DN4552_c0_g1_i1.p1 TRINITY_DN4552_c0_g1~~TRINITY_DN4552_c0_g1_i1.p1  ORF type:complete len:323 (+),score=107.95 TRINITY_DN4552_c0_g1_i1:68-1036(+)